MRRAPEPRGTLKPFWNIISDGTITDYAPTTISIDTHNRDNNRMRKCDLVNKYIAKTNTTTTNTKTQTPTNGFLRM